MAPAINIKAGVYPTTSKYNMLPIYLRAKFWIILRKFASLPLDFMGIYKYLMAKLKNMHKYLQEYVSLIIELYKNYVSVSSHVYIADKEFDWISP